MKKHTSIKKTVNGSNKDYKIKNKYSELRIFIDSELKNQSEITLKEMGIDMTTALRVLLLRIVVEQRFPFLIQLPDTTKAQLNRL